MDTETLAVAKKYTSDSVIGLGSIKGANCTISKTQTLENGNVEVTFKWTGTDGTERTETITVKKGNDGTSVTGVSININNHLIITLSDETTIDAGEMPQEEIGISSETGNIIVKKDDGLYVPATGVKISSLSDNTIQEKSDGLYVAKVDISNKVDKVEGKGLSTVDFTDTSYVHTDNNFTTALKQKLTTINIDNYVEKEDGKGLSTNDFTTEEKTKVDNLDTSKYVEKVEGKGLSTVDFTDKNYVHTDNNFTTEEKTKVDNLDTSKYVEKEEGKGLSTNDFTTEEKTKVDSTSIFTEEEKTKLAGIEEGATKVIVDEAFSSTSANPVQNKVISDAMGAANGFATLDANGKLLSSQLPTSARQIVGQLDAENTHTLPEASEYNAGDEFLVISAGYYTQPTAFTLEAGNTLTEMEVYQANLLIANSYVFTIIDSASTTLGTVTSFETNKITFDNGTSITLPYSTDLSATSEPSIVQVTVAIGDEIMNIDDHWIHLSNTSNVTSVNSKTGAVVLAASDVGAVSTNNIVSVFNETTSDLNVPSEKLVKSTIDKKVDKEDGKGLSTNDFTTEEKTKLANIDTSIFVEKEEGKGLSTNDFTTEEKTKVDNLDTSIYAKTADLSTVAKTGNYSDLIDAPVVPTKISELTNDSGYITGDDVYIKSEVNTLCKFTNTEGSTVAVGNIPIGQTFNNATLPEIMTLMLYGAVATPAPTASGDLIVDSINNKATIPLTKSSYYKTTIVDSSKITVNKGTISSTSITTSGLVINFSDMQSGAYITIDDGALQNTTTNSAVYTGNATNDIFTEYLSFTRQTLPTPSISLGYKPLSKSVAITISSASYNSSYATLSTLSSSSISGVEGILTGSGTSYEYTLPSDIAAGDYTIKVAENAVTLSASQGYYEAATNGTSEVSLAFTVEESGGDEYDTEEKTLAAGGAIDLTSSLFICDTFDDLTTEEIVENFVIVFKGVEGDATKEILVPFADVYKTSPIDTSSLSGTPLDGKIPSTANWDMIDPDVGTIELLGFTLSSNMIFEFRRKKTS